MKESDIRTGIVWNLISYIFLGLFTIISYWLITWQYGEGALGAYNIVLSIFMICGHIGVFGLQSAAVYFIPRMAGDRKRLGKCFFSYLVIALTVSILLGILLFLSAEFTADCIFHSAQMEAGLKKIAPAVVLFSVNKMLGGYVNGMGMMREFAVLQGVRYIFIVAFIGIGAVLGFSFENIFYAFLVSELAVLLFGISFLYKKFEFGKPEAAYLREGLKFGSKAMFGNVISDINTRIDVMMLGVLCTDNIVGLYSFITIIAEGLMSVLFVFRNNYNPHFSDLIFKGKIKELEVLFGKIKKMARILFGGLGVGIFAAYAVFCRLFLNEAYMRSILPAAIIIIGCMIMAPYFIAGNLCTLSGKPMIDTFITIVTILVNIIFNYVFIVKIQLTGAALATGISYVIFAGLMSHFIKKKVLV